MTRDQQLYQVYAAFATFTGEPVMSGAALGITGLSGGGPTKLDGVPTVGGVALNRIIYVDDQVSGTGFQPWRCVAGTSVDDPANGTLLPDDYGPSNHYYWKI